MPVPASEKKAERPEKTPRLRLSFWGGFIAGLTAAVASAGILTLGAISYVRDRAATAAIPATRLSPAFVAGGRVQLYFPLERFLTWRSTPQIQFDMIGDQVHIRLSVQPLQAFPWRVPVDIYGVPGVARGYFELTQVRGRVDHLPVPTGMLLDAIAIEGLKYGVHVNASKDELFVEKTFGPYRLVGYDVLARDLIISLPVRTVENAARGQASL